MQKCEKCTREPNSSNKEHLCANTNSIENYIAAQPIDYELIADIVRWRVNQVGGNRD